MPCARRKPRPRKQRNSAAYDRLRVEPNAQAYQCRILDLVREPIPQLEERVRSKVASGPYTSASEVVREALRLMDEQDRLREAKLVQLHSDFRRGLDSGPSETWDAEAVKRQARPVELPSQRLLKYRG